MALANPSHKPYNDKKNAQHVHTGCTTCTRTHTNTNMRTRMRTHTPPCAHTPAHPHTNSPTNTYAHTASTQQVQTYVHILLTIHLWQIWPDLTGTNSHLHPQQLLPAHTHTHTHIHIQIHANSTFVLPPTCDTAWSTCDTAFYPPVTLPPIHL